MSCVLPSLSPDQWKSLATPFFLVFPLHWPSPLRSWACSFIPCSPGRRCLPSISPPSPVMDFVTFSSTKNPPNKHRGGGGWGPFLPRGFFPLRKSKGKPKFKFVYHRMFYAITSMLEQCSRSLIVLHLPHFRTFIFFLADCPSPLHTSRPHGCVFTWNADFFLFAQGPMKWPSFSPRLERRVDYFSPGNRSRPVFIHSLFPSSSALSASFHSFR